MDDTKEFSPAGHDHGNFRMFLRIDSAAKPNQWIIQGTQMK